MYKLSIKNIPIKGLTLDMAILSFGKQRGTYGDDPHGLSFVALSRTRSLNDILINVWGFDAQRLTSIRLPFHFVEFDKRTLELAEATKTRLQI